MSTPELTDHLGRQFLTAIMKHPENDQTYIAAINALAIVMTQMAIRRTDQEHAPEVVSRAINVALRVWKITGKV